MDAAAAAAGARSDRLGKLEQQPEPQPEPQSQQQDTEIDELEPAVEDVGMGWSRVTEDDGAVFYWHEASEQSQWEPPAHLRDAEPAPAPAPPKVLQRQLQTVSGLKLPVVMERSEDEQRSSPEDEQRHSPSDGALPEGAVASTQPADAASASASTEAGSASQVKRMTGSPDQALCTKAQPLREPLKRQVYRGSNSDTQLTWGTKLAWADDGADDVAHAHASASPAALRPDSSSRVRKGKPVHWQEWTVEEVLVWLASLDVEVKECSEVFRKQRVKGKHLKKLDDELLLKLGISAFGDRDAILEARDRLSDDQERIRLAAAARATGSNPHSPVVKSLPSPGSGSPATGTSRLKPSSSSSFPGSRPPPGERENEAQVLVGANSGDPLVVYTERPLGGGAAGSVFEGWYQGQFVAVKRMNETEKQAVKELDVYRNSAANRHPNIVFTHGFKVEHSLVYLIMDRCDCSLSTSGGKTSSTFVRRLRTSSELPRDIAKQLLTGISQLHSLHVIHRDLKPSNVLVRNSAAALAVEDSAASASKKRNDGRQPQICLCDMGLSKRQSADYSISTLGDDVGTLGWRAPELRKAGAQATEASDVYTAGLIVYYILTAGCHVFDDEEDACNECATERQLSQLAYARQEAIDECGREWERVQKYGSRTSTTNVFALSASHRDLLSAEKEAEREQLTDSIVERLSKYRVHAPSPTAEGVVASGSTTPPQQGFRLPSSRCSDDGSVTEISTEAVSLLSRLLHPDPKKRPTAGEALGHPFFQVVLEGQDQIAESELTIGGAIGDGAMGIVYRAKWRETDVAVKRLKRTDGNSQNQIGNAALQETELLDDFVREVTLLKALRHPHVVLFMGWFLSSSPYLAADAEHKSLCFVTELCWTSLYHLLHTRSGKSSSSNGGSHAKINAQHLHWARRLAMCLDASKGMCFLHGEGIIHRDLKSANLLVDRSYRVKVCDFGLARALRDPSRRRVGTPQYDAPEVIVDGKPGDKFSDVYSFGVVLWETALLRKPYGSLAEQVGASGPLFCAIMENYSSNIGLPMDDWPTAASEAGADGCVNKGAGAVGLIGEDLRQLVEACLYLKHTKKTPRPTFETIASALAGMLQKLRHRANMERRDAERSSNQSADRKRIIPGGVVSGDPLTPRRELSSNGTSNGTSDGTIEPGLPTSPSASQRGGLMTPLAPLGQERSAADSAKVSFDAASSVSPGLSAPSASTRPSVTHGGRRAVHMLRAAPDAPGVLARSGGPSPTPPLRASPPPSGAKVESPSMQVTTAEAARRAARADE